LRHVTPIGDLLLAMAGLIARREQALLLDKTVEIGRGHDPAVALIFDKGVNDRDRAGLVAFDQFDAAEQRRRIGESGDFGKETPHLDLRIDAGLELAVEFYDI